MKLHEYLAAKNRTIHHERLCVVHAIDQGETLKLTYQGDDRHVIPLCWGVLKNGKTALLCYKILGVANGSFELAIRLYHETKIRDVENTWIELPVGRDIDYYLTKHFKDIYAKTA